MDTNKEKIEDSKRKDKIVKAQSLVIKNQAEVIKKMKDKEVKEVEHIQVKKDENKPIHKKSSLKPIPDHLSPVNSKHLNDLKGHSMKCNGNPGGDCLSSCTIIHLSFTKDRSERRR